MQTLAVSLHQPWATLAAHGIKAHETRSWSTRHRGPLAIHAAQARPAYARDFMRTSLACRRALRGLGYAVDGHDLPRGALVGLVDLVDCQPTPEALPGDLGLFATCAVPVDEEDLAFGDWSPGRYAWRLERPRPFEDPIVERGRQGLWQLHPDQVERLTLALGAIA